MWRGWLATDSHDGWCHRRQNSRLCSRPHYHESLIFFRIFGIHTFYATATLLNIYEYAGNEHAAVVVGADWNLHIASRQPLEGRC